ncbi:MAG: helix-turn-helix transcriptional regulator [Synechococcaceae cyanobacterium SM2_3_2]|nr:helix-turn-helix transcriptional regulator [Synechococcaceae cyanobacterium SM2_3_2]
MSRRPWVNEKSPPSLEEAQVADSIARRLRLVIGHESINHFAGRLGIPESTIRKYLMGSKPGADRLRIIAEHTGASVDWLLTGQGAMLLNPELAKRVEEAEKSQPATGKDAWVSLPLLDIAAGAGSGTFVDEEVGEDVIAFRESWIRQRFMTSPQGLNLIHVRGESMEPTLRSGDIILVDTKAKDPREGICVLKLDGTLLVKRVAVYPGRQLEVSSDNPAYRPFTIDLKDPPEDFGVIGRVLWSFRSH